MLRNYVGALLLLAACAPDEGELEVRIYGEAFIEEGIPASVFADGWAVQFDSFLISVGTVSVAPTMEDGAGLDVFPFQVYDLSQPSMGLGQRVGGGQVEAGLEYGAAFEVAPDAAAVASGVSEADLARMRDGGLALYVAGSATKAGETKRFAWGFTTSTVYGDCETEVEVGAAPATVELTIHGDHLFYDDLFSETPDVRFDLVAQADADGDGEVTQAELLAVDLRPLANYQVGSTGIVDLWHFIEYQTRSLGHIDGEGHCRNTAEE